MLDVPARGGDDVADENMAVFEVAPRAGAFPQPSEAGEEDALVVGVDHFVPDVAFAAADGAVDPPASPAADVVAVCEQALRVGHVARAEPFVSVDCRLEVFRIVRSCRERRVLVDGVFSRGKWRGVLVSRKVKIHVHARGDEELVRDGVLVRCERRVPDHAATAKRGVPTLGGQIVEDTGTVGESWDELGCIPRRGVVRGGRGGRGCVMAIHMKSNELHAFQPTQNHPKHIVIRLGAQTERILSEIK